MQQTPVGAAIRGVAPTSGRRKEDTRSAAQIQAVHCIQHAWHNAAMAYPRKSRAPDSTRCDKDTCADPIDPRAFGLAKAAYAVGETLDLLSIGRTSLYAAVKRGDLKCVKFGKKTLFYAADLASFLTRLRRMSEVKTDRVGRSPSSSKSFERS
jgi:hypothetical protein